MQNVIELGFSPDITRDQKAVIEALNNVYGAAKKLDGLRIELKFSDNLTDLRKILSDINQTYADINKTLQQYNNLVNQQAQAAKDAQQAEQAKAQAIQQTAAAASVASKSAVELNSQYQKLTGSLESNIAQLARNKQALTDNRAAQAALQTQYAGSTASMSAYRAALNNLQTEEKILTAAVAEQQGMIGAQAKNAIAAEGSYNSLQQTLTSLQRTYLALSEAERNSVMGIGLQKDIQSTRAQLSAIDASLGNFQRNVGNYGSTISGAFSQTFARSIHAGAESLAGISRGTTALMVDLPNLIQQLTDMKIAQDGITASGGKGLTTLQLLKAAFNPLTVAIQLGVLVLLRYSGAIYDWATGADKAKAAAKELADQQQKLDQIQQSANQNVAGLVVNIRLLESTMTDANLPLKNRTDAYKEFQKLYPSFLENVSQEDALTGGLAKTIDTELIPSLIRLATAEAGKGILKDYDTQLFKIIQQIKDVKKASDDAKNSSDIFSDPKVYQTYIDGTVGYTDNKLAKLQKQFQDLNKSAYAMVQTIADVQKTTPKLNIDGTDINAKKSKKTRDTSISDAVAKENASKAAIYNIDKNYADLTTKLQKETADNIAAAQVDSEQKQLDIAETKYKNELAAYDNYLADFNKKGLQRIATLKANGIEEINNSKASADKKAASLEALNANIAAVQKKFDSDSLNLEDTTNKAKEALKNNYYNTISQIDDKFSSDQEIAQESLNATRNKLYGDDNANAIAAVNTKYDKMREALKNKGELTNELAVQIAQTQEDEIAVIRAKGDSLTIQQINTASNNEQTALLEKYNQGKITYEQYQRDLIAIQEKYSQESLSVAINATKAQIAATTDPALLKALEAQLAQLNLAYDKSYSKQDSLNQKLTDDTKKAWQQVANTALKGIQTIVDATYQKHIKSVQDLQAAQDAQYQKEISNIQNSTLSATDKAEKIAIAQAKQDAADKASAAKQKKLQHDQAVFDKEMSLAQIIMNTAVAITKTFSEFGFPFGVPLAIAQAAEGAVEAAIVIATPIPAYATGTENHPGGPALVGEGKHKELVETPSGKSFVVDKPTILDLPAQSKVIPLSDDFLQRQSAYANNYVNKLSEWYERNQRNENWAIAAWQVREMRKANEVSKKRTILQNNIIVDFGWMKYINRNIKGIKE